MNHVKERPQTSTLHPSVMWFSLRGSPTLLLTSIRGLVPLSNQWLCRSWMSCCCSQESLLTGSFSVLDISITLQVKKWLVLWPYSRKINCSIPGGSQWSSCMESACFTLVVSFSFLLIPLLLLFLLLLLLFLYCTDDVPKWVYYHSYLIKIKHFIHMKQLLVLLLEKFLS